MCATCRLQSKSSVLTKGGLIKKCLAVNEQMSLPAKQCGGYK